MKQIRKAISLKLFGRSVPAAPATKIKQLDDAQLKAVSGGAPNGTWAPNGSW